MKLVHTMLLFIREQKKEEDIQRVMRCLISLKESTYQTVVLFNQGCFTNEELKMFLSAVPMELRIIGEGQNMGTTLARQACFSYIYKELPGTEYISEIHPDMVFTPHWEDPLVDFLEQNDEPVISCGIVDKKGEMPFLHKKVTLPEKDEEVVPFLEGLKADIILPGFSNPCIHNAEVLKAVGGYDAKFLKGPQCFEDDSLLLGYYYYYGTRAGWIPKINFRSVVLHEIAGQRIGLGQNMLTNFQGLCKQYGAMGLRHLSSIHSSFWHKGFFAQEYQKMINS